MSKEMNLGNKREQASIHKIDLSHDLLAQIRWTVRAQKEALKSKEVLKEK